MLRHCVGLKHKLDEKLIQATRNFAGQRNRG
jgi:hypothetical protein